MKATLSKSLFLALCYYTFLLAGCIKDQCNCPVPKSGKFKYTQMAATNLLYAFPDAQTFLSTIHSADTIDKSQYGVRFEFEYRMAYQKRQRPVSLCFTNTAYACSCVEDNFTSADTVKKISLLTLFDFDVTHAAGSDISAYFKRVYPDYSSKSFTFAPAFPEGYTELNNQISAEGKKEVELFLQQKVTESKLVAFELVVEYSSGTKTSVKTKPIFLK